MHIKSGASVSARDTPDDMRSCGARGSDALRDEERETHERANARIRERKKGAQTGVCTPSCDDLRLESRGR